MQNRSFDFEIINVCHVISFKARVPLMDLFEGKSLEIDAVSQNRLNAIKNHENWRKFEKTVLESS